jgi:hypothetical protein
VSRGEYRACSSLAADFDVFVIVSIWPLGRLIMKDVWPVSEPYLLIRDISLFLVSVSYFSGHYLH